MSADGVELVVYSIHLGDFVGEHHGGCIGAVEDGVEARAGMERAGMQNADAAGGEIAHPDFEWVEAPAIGAEGGDLHSTAHAHARAASLFVKMTPAIGFERADDFLVALGGESHG